MLSRPCNVLPLGRKKTLMESIRNMLYVREVSFSQIQKIDGYIHSEMTLWVMVDQEKHFDSRAKKVMDELKEILKNSPYNLFEYRKEAE